MTKFYKFPLEQYRTTCQETFGNIFEKETLNEKHTWITEETLDKHSKTYGGFFFSIKIEIEKNMLKKSRFNVRVY